ncbi:MAG TPA: hypothetical protein VF613_18180 [Longimicrobium sp.]
MAVRDREVPSHTAPRRDDTHKPGPSSARGLSIRARLIALVALTTLALLVVGTAGIVQVRAALDRLAGTVFPG